ncbi:hypothetical protein [Aquirufa regiilacus]|jgi:hypothetical protein|uniref:Class IIb bacteriocin, lactobin A/cerein 7B family n=1 Tax=Aquirufa regiilacus TaxID=3024868 RepID=A0ABU3TQ16_9BACT|nr:hypothetical protein [Aquirufa sp. LEOWEIH-7C]MBP6055703.1 hypothetical protein [Cytophagaceae bacterium]MBP6094396.1 hypothetical protein [Cytophagaceae bacterium]MDU0807915.1 hypothetical protein [Aquirufa sp. LEOWEIH-7C]
MKKEFFPVSAWGMQELNMMELIQIDGGGFWETFGIITGVAVVIAAVIYTGGIIAFLL